jgi:hypothetical protein
MKPEWKYSVPRISPGKVMTPACKFIWLLLFYLPLHAGAQQDSAGKAGEYIPDEETIQNMEMQAETGDAQGTDYSELTEEKAWYLHHPLNLIAANEEEIRHSGILNEIQLANLTEHIRRTGPLLSVYELQAIAGFDAQSLQKILPFIVIDIHAATALPGLKERFSNGEHRILNRAERVVEQQKGFLPPDNSGKSQTRYLGSPLRYYTTYRYNSSNKLSWGMGGKKDAGEQFLKGSQAYGFDFYSAHLVLRNYKCIQTLVLGDYSAGFGQGLISWTGIALSKTSDAFVVKKTAAGLKPYTSTNENTFLRGAGITLAAGSHTALSAFYSHKHLDATVATRSSDSTITGVKSLQTTGIHATAAEMASRHTLGQMVYGANFAFTQHKLRISCTVMQTKLSAALEPRPALYNQFEFRGKSIQNGGTEYTLVFRNMMLFGEIACSHTENQSLSDAGTAWIQGILFLPDPRLELAFLVRDYSRNYQSLYAKGFAESSKTTNEQGVYLGAVLKPHRAIKLSVYFDNYIQPWLQYRVNSPMEGTDFFSRLTYTPDKYTEFYLSYRRHRKASDPPAGAAEEILFPVEGIQSNVRFQLGIKIRSGLEARSRLELIEASDSLQSIEKGYMISQDLVLKTAHHWSLTMRYALFDTPGGNTRIYALSHSVPGAYAIPSFFARGSQTNLLLSVRPGKGFMLWLALSRIFYDSKNTIAAGTLNEIKGPHETSLSCQLQWTISSVRKPNNFTP